MKGKVYLVGAGPGDPGLITVRGAACLRRADVVVYDRLAAPALLEYAPAHAERIYVGKAAGDHCLPQAEINHLLVERARAGCCVVRLKGGDPFVFGRGGEEALALAEAGIPFEVVPGVSSSIAVPAYAGIPVTHRGMASSFVVRTGHTADATGPQVDRLAFGSAAHDSTVIYLMGVEKLAAIVAELLAEGRAPATPAALIRWGTTPRQRTVTGRLDAIAELGRDMEPPALLVVGEVVRLRQRLDWFESRPLQGRRVVVTRAREQAGELAARLAEAGAEPIEFPTIAIEPVADATPLDRALLEPYDWVIFTSVNGVEAVWTRLRALGRDARSLGDARLGAIGPATAAALAAHGLYADFVPAEYVAEAIVAGLGPVAGQRILLPRSDAARPTLAEGLRERGAHVTDVVVYRTVTAGRDDRRGRAIAAMLAAGQVDALTFTSSSTVRGFATALGLSADGQPEFGVWPCVACIGPITAQTARKHGIPVHVVASTYTVAGLVDALIAYYGGNKQS
jgi:uroporphyrinogen III methyltransferase/synthase